MARVPRGGGEPQDQGNGDLGLGRPRRHRQVRRRHRRRLLRPHARAAFAPLPDRRRRQGEGRPAHRRPPHGRGHRHRDRPGAVQGAGRAARHHALRLDRPRHGRDADARRDRRVRPALPGLERRLSSPKIGTFDTELVREFFQALAQNAGITLHVRNHYGANNHHIAETCFKAVARVLRTAIELDPRQPGASRRPRAALKGLSDGHLCRHGAAAAGARRARRGLRARRLSRARLPRAASSGCCGTGCGSRRAAGDRRRLCAAGWAIGAGARLRRRRAAGARFLVSIYVGLEGRRCGSRRCAGAARRSWRRSSRRIDRRRRDPLLRGSAIPRQRHDRADARPRPPCRAALPRRRRRAAHGPALGLLAYPGRPNPGRH